MKLRVYDAARGSRDRHKFENYPDRYALYFPHPKKWIKDDLESYGEHITGDYLNFSFSEGGKTITRCCWDEWNLRNGLCDNLGKKVKIESLPEPVQKWINGYEIAYNDLIKNPEDEDAIERWESYF